MPRNRLPGQREAIILSILLQGEMYGLELRNHYSSRTGHDLPLGSLYPTMDAMIRKGFVRARTGNSEHIKGGNRRRYYRITANGEAALRELQLAVSAERRLA